MLTEIFHCGYSALGKVRDAVDGATKAKGVGDVAHPRYLDRSQDRKKGSGSPHGRGYIIRERIPTGPLLIFFVYIAYDIIEISRILKHFFVIKRVFDIMNERIYYKYTFLILFAISSISKYWLITVDGE